MKIFKRKIELKISRMDTKERVLFLANKLMDELEQNGYETSVSCNGSRYVDITHYDSGTFRVGNSIARTGGWSIGGKRQYKPYKEDSK